MMKAILLTNLRQALAGARRPGATPRNLVLLLNTGAVAPFWADLCRALQAYDVSVHVIASRGHAFSCRPFKARTAANTRNYRASRVVPSIRTLRAALRLRGTTVVAVEYGVQTAVAVCMSRLAGRQIFIFQEHAGRLGKPLSTFDRRYRRRLAQLATGVIANTDAAQCEAEQVLRLPARKVRRATLLVPPARQTLDIKPFDDPREDPRTPVFLYIGQLVPRKNVQALVRSAHALHQEGHAFTVWIVGDGPERSCLEAITGRLPDSIVRFFGAVSSDAIGGILAAADVFVMPSFRDYRSVAVLEALRFGVPVIDSNADGNVGDFVIHERTGLVIDPSEPASLVAAMRRMLCEPELRNYLKREIEALMEQHTPESAATRMLTVLQSHDTRRSLCRVAREGDRPRITDERVT